MVIFWENKSEIVVLTEKESFIIEPANTWHIHVNPFDKISITYWDFDGDIRKIIDDIKKSAEE